MVLGPGCFCYSLILPIPAESSQIGISGVTRSVMQLLADAVSTSEMPVTVRGISDLVLGEQKFSGNAQRWKRHVFLHHGTLLYDFDLSRVSRYLRIPTCQPEYRRERPHADFVCNLPRPRDELISCLRRAWNAG